MPRRLKSKARSRRSRARNWLVRANAGAGCALTGVQPRHRSGCSCLRRLPQSWVPRRNLGAASPSAGRCEIGKMLFAPFRSGTTHIMILGPVSPHRPVPGRTEKRQQGADRAADKADGSQSSMRISTRSCKPVGNRRLAPMRPVVIVAGQIAVFFIACSKLRHLLYSTVNRDWPPARWNMALKSIGNRDGCPPPRIGAA